MRDSCIYTLLDNSFKTLVLGDVEFTFKIRIASNHLENHFSDSLFTQNSCNAYAAAGKFATINKEIEGGVGRYRWGLLQAWASGH
jgi:hypothetical protein